MKRITLRVSLLCVTSTGIAWAQDPTVPPTAAEPAPAASPAQPTPAPAPAPMPAPPAAAPAPPPVSLHYLPKTRPYRDDAPPPEHYVLSEEPRKGFVIGGVVAIGAPYITGLIIAGVGMDFPNKSGFLAVPVAGPWITLALRDSCDESAELDFECADDDLARRALMFDGIVQGLGAAALVTGLTWTRSVWLREDLADNIDFVPGLNVVGLPGDTPHGMTVVGRF